ncbi:alpha/beta hydrolase domain-containing protein [Coprinopsis cinerea AmutBmut pab1-1]|nr:alpha/beta hydrolase domain-containing protein [Coprinopsis cinerea AmutBmut pab1-1]
MSNPIHPSLLDKLDPEFINFYNRELIHIVPPHTLPWTPEIRNAPAVPGGSTPLPVGRIQDFDVEKTRVRVYTPPGEVPGGGWPVFLFFHGGGWTLGNIASESAFCTNMCIGADCVVISVDYRLAPENPYPAAVQDAVDALVWTVHTGAKLLDLDLGRLAVGGSSSGGNLAAVLAIKANTNQLPTTTSTPLPTNLIKFQLLIVPVIDNTLSPTSESTTSTNSTSTWSTNQHTPWLTPARMLWFRSNYLPNPTDRGNWDASPIFAPAEWVRGLPKTWIALAELDILCGEGLEYAEKLKKEGGVEVEVEVYRGAPHPVMAMDGVLSVGRKLVKDAAGKLKEAFEALNK